ncbi:MAG TPA: hypothetical protein VEG44_08950 [Candidatus Acidoferrales bacterium]|nr:hypothetical protein [Candidatus Acidoferrales bacterium]
MNTSDQRAKFLCGIYDYVQGIPYKIANDFHDIAKDWGYDDEEIINFSRLFNKKGCLKICESSGRISSVELTFYGIEYVQYEYAQSTYR